MIHHKELTADRWHEFSLVEQLANIGSDIERTIQGRKKGDLDYSSKAFDWALELFYLTISDPKNRKRLKEILRAREMLIDYFIYNNMYSSTEESWQQYFLQFAYAAALVRAQRRNVKKN